jgi:hypothetical protein
MPWAFPPSSQTNKNTATIFWIHSFFIQAIDEIDFTNRSIHRLKECVADPPIQESQLKEIAGTNQREWDRLD